MWGDRVFNGFQDRVVVHGSRERVATQPIRENF